jgi:hypothetical protein
MEHRLMTSYLMSLQNRRKKRNIYLRATRLLGDLKDTLREIGEFSGDLTSDYSDLSEIKSQRLAGEVRDAMREVDIKVGPRRERLDDVLSKFNNLPEEIS